MKHLIFFIFLFLYGDFILAGDLQISGYFACKKNELETHDKKIVIFFLNGIKNDKTQAELSASIFKKRLYQNSYFNENLKKYVEVKNLYNSTESFYDDVLELSVQGDIQQVALNATEAKIKNSGLEDRLPEDVLKNVKKSIYSIELNYAYQRWWALVFSRSFQDQSLPTDEAAERLIRQYQILSNDVIESLLQGKKVIIVAHSQGNYVAQGIYSYISNMPLLRESALSSLRVVGVANVAATTPNNFYTTIKQDLAVFLAHDGYQGGSPMQENFDAIFSSGIELDALIDRNDRNNHSFIETYMNAALNKMGEPIWYDFPIVRRNSSPYEFLHQKIVKDVIHGIDEAEFPPQIVNEGIISSTLTWLGNDDIDLHVNEPYEEVHYANQDGDIGFLDVDDYDGQGPEHYYGSCKNLIEFQNRNSFLSYFITFSVNQYKARKTEPENVTLYLSVGGYSLPIENFNLSPSFPRKNVYKLELFKKGESSTSMIFGFKMYKL